MLEESSGSLRLIWTPFGQVQSEPTGKIRFPAAKQVGGLYRFRVFYSSGERAVYVGETDNLERRFAHYRNPGPTQVTNIRINALFAEVLTSGGTIDLDIVVDQAWINTGGADCAADLTRKDTRRLFENFVLVSQRVVGIECLNR